MTEAEAEKQIQKDQIATAINFLREQFDQPEIKIAVCTFPDGAHPFVAFTNSDPQLDSDAFQSQSRQSISAQSLCHRQTPGGHFWSGFEIVKRRLHTHQRTWTTGGRPDVRARNRAVAEAEQIGQALTGSEVVFLVDGHVAASSLRDPNSQPELTAQIRQFSPAAGAAANNSPRKIRLSGQHYMCVLGHFSSLDGDKGLGYILASSYQSAWVDWENDPAHFAADRFVRDNRGRGHHLAARAAGNASVATIAR